MRRMYTVKRFKEIVTKIKKQNPYFNITTDIIVGFPNESDDDFDASCRLINKLNFGHVHTFKYSVRKGTRAERMPNQIDEHIKTKRSETLRGISKDVKIEYRKSFIGKEQIVLAEKIINNKAKGYGENYIPVEFRGNNIKKNQFYKVKINSILDDNDDSVLCGKLI